MRHLLPFFQNQCYHSVRRLPRRIRGRERARMEQAIIPLPNRRRLKAEDRALRRKRIFARLREGWAYEEIAREERLTTERVREIVNEVLNAAEGRRQPCACAAST